MYRREETLDKFAAPFTGFYDPNAGPDGRGYGVLTDADRRLVSFFRTRRDAHSEAVTLNKLARQRRAQGQH